MSRLRSAYNRVFGQPGGGRFSFYPVGFHGDTHLLRVVDSIRPRVDAFLETGANVGSTLAYVAQRFGDLPCLSCEPDEAAFRAARKNTERLENVRLYNQTSQAFMAGLEGSQLIRFDSTVLCWLDAHGYGFEWPLGEEIAFITRRFQTAFILIDDFRVPGREQFGFDRYGDQECSMDFVRSSFAPGRAYRLYYPGYTQKTGHHDLRGWGLVTMDVAEWAPDRLGDAIEERPWDVGVGDAGVVAG